jgi:hypothetical protein
LNTSLVKYLWFRDKADLLKNPSIDRIDSTKDYTLDNCQYIERGINCGKHTKNKISFEIAEEIRKKKKEGISDVKLAKLYGLNRGFIYQICNNRKYKKELYRGVTNVSHK